MNNLSIIAKSRLNRVRDNSLWSKIAFERGVGCFSMTKRAGNRRFLGASKHLETSRGRNLYLVKNPDASKLESSHDAYEVDCLYWTLGDRYMKCFGSLIIRRVSHWSELWTRRGNGFMQVLWAWNSYSNAKSGNGYAGTEIEYDVCTFQNFAQPETRV